MNAIDSFIHDKWYQLLKQSGDFSLTESAAGYCLMYGENLAYELKQANDILENQTQEEQKKILCDFGFLHIDKKNEVNIFYKEGRLIAQSNKDMAMVYQYRGNAPEVMLRTKTFVKSGDIYSDCITHSLGLISINKYMEDNGSFIEPWDINNFGSVNKNLVYDFIDRIPKFYSDTLTGYYETF